MRPTLSAVGRNGEYGRLAAICVSTVFIMSGQGIISPVLPLYADSFGVSTSLIGAAISAFGLARLITNVPAGILADRRGRRKLLVGGPLLTAVGMFGSGIADSIWPLLVFRFVAGFGSGLYMTGAQIYLLDIAEPHQRGRFIATNQGALIVGTSTGPAIGGLIADAYGLSAPFFVVAMTGLATAVYSYLRLDETRPGQAWARSPSANSGNRFALLRNLDFLLLGLITFSVFCVRSGVRQTLVPLRLNQAFGLQVDELGLLFTALGVVGVFLIWPAGWSADRFGPKVVIVPTALAISLGVAIVALADSLPVFILGLFVTTLGSSVTGPAPAAYVARLAGDEETGAAMGLYRTFGDVGVVSAPIVSGALADAVSIPFAIGMVAALMFAASVAFGLLASNPEP